jgi:hypothetical protein
MNPQLEIFKNLKNLRTPKSITKTNSQRKKVKELSRTLPSRKG